MPRRAGVVFQRAIVEINNGLGALAIVTGTEIPGFVACGNAEWLAHFLKNEAVPKFIFLTLLTKIYHAHVTPAPPDCCHIP